VNAYTYTALEPTGKRRTGVIEAPNREAAIARIAAQGRFVVEISEQAQKGRARSAPRKGKVSRSDLAVFTRRLADLSGAGLPLDRVLQVVAEQSESKTLTEISLQALEDVRGGLPVSEALAKHPKIFSDVFTQTLRAGEASGQFPEVASRLADFQEKEVARRSQIGSALVYPAVLTFTAVSVVIFLITFVVPRLAPVFEDLGTDLPVTTQILLGTTGFITSNGLIIVGTLVGLFVLYRGWSATPAGALARDRAFLRLPLVGPVALKSTVSRFARVLGTLVFGGVPILEAIRLSGLASGNAAFAEAARRVEDDVREGRSIAESMRDAGSFPPVLTHMVAIGEETGELPKMLGRVSDSLDFEVDTSLRRLTSLVEPVIVLTMGGFVGFVVLSVLLPIFQAQQAVK
jgi:type II secretory pathway component PulF